MEVKIREWLEKTGYPLELYVHEQLVKRKFLCEKSSLYSDIESGAKREIDLAAYLHGPSYETHSYSLQLLVECKKSEKPLIVLSEDAKKKRFEILFGSEPLSETFMCLAFAYFNFVELDEESQKEKIGAFCDKVPVGYSIVPAFSKSDENIYKGLMGLAKADEYYRNRQIEFMKTVREDASVNHLVDNNPFQLQVPILVVDSPLFCASVDKSGELQVTSTDWACLNLRLPWNLDESERMCPIQIVQKESFLKVIEDFEQLLEYLSLPEVVGPAIRNITSKSTRKKKIFAFILRLFRRYV